MTEGVAMKAVRVAISILLIASGMYLALLAFKLHVPETIAGHRIWGIGSDWLYRCRPPMLIAAIFLIAAFVWLAFGKRLLKDVSNTKWLAIILGAVGCVYVLSGLVQILSVEVSAAQEPGSQGVSLSYLIAVLAGLIVSAVLIVGGIGMLRGYMRGWWIVFTVVCLGTVHAIGDAVSLTVDPNLDVTADKLWTIVAGVLLLVALRWLRSDPALAE